MRELAALFVPAPNAGPGRYMVYPAHDERVLRVLRKIVRGLSHDHEIESAVADHRVLVDILKYQIPDELMVAATEFHRERDIIEYGYALYDSGELSSAWTVRLFGKVIFIAWIRRSLS